MPSTMDAILTEVGRGSPQAVEDCIQRFSGPVWNLARRYSPTEQDAEDAVQEIFLDLWKSAARFDPAQGSAMTFVMTIARRRLIDRGRRRSRAPSVQNLEEPEILPDAPAESEVEVKDEAARISAAFERLRPEVRHVLELSLVHGRSHQQIAGATGLALGTVKSHARRGLMRVRAMLGAAESPEPAERAEP